MPKIRGIKPDFWTDDVVVELSPLSRLLFMGLWTYACDNGHVEDKPRQIKMRILPADDCKVGDLLTELETAGRVERKDGWVLIPNFVKHQKVDKRFFVTCGRPDCHKPGEEPETATSQPASRRGHDEGTTSPPRGHDVGSQRPPGDGDGDGDGELMVMVNDAPKGAPRGKRATALAASWQPSEDHRKIANDERRDLVREVTLFRDDCASKGRTTKDWDAAFRNWLRSNYGFRRPEDTRRLPASHELELPPDGLSPEEYAAWERDSRARRQAR